MECIDYSVVIRTTGNAHEKYQALLDSVSKLEPQPKEIIVVLPEGYALPNERLGWETFYFCPKGMVIQRMTGIAKCKTKYALVCDDDVTFGTDFVQKLYEPIRLGLCRFSAGPLYSFLPPKGANAVLCTVMASATPTIFHKKDRYVSVLKSSGYSYNRHLHSGQYYETQSVAWTCFFADIQAILDIAFEEETWLDAHGYSAMDDQTMFYKAWLRGYKTVVVADAQYVHMDAKTSTRNNKPSVLYSAMFNRVIFWHRFIYSTQENPIQRGIARISFAYRLLWIYLWDRIGFLRHRMSREDLIVVKQSFVDAKSFLKSEEYLKLPGVRKESV